MFSGTSNYENFGKTSDPQKSASDVFSGRPETGYKSLDERFFKIENIIEFTYRIERNLKPAMTRRYNLQTQVITEQGTSFWISVVRLLLVTCGTPIVIIPSFFISTGYICGSVLLIVVICFYLHTMHMAIWSAEQISKLDDSVEVVYSDLLYQSLVVDRPWVRPWLGSLVRAASTGVTSLSWYSLCIFVYLLAAENVRTVCNEWFYCQLEVKDILLILVLPVLVLCIISKAEYLESFAAFGFFCNLISLVLLAFYILTDPSPWMLGSANGSLSKPLYIGVILINLSVTPAVLLFKNETKNMRKFESPGGVLTVGYLAILVIYLTFSLLCGLKYGDGVPLNAINLLPHGNIIARICPIFFAIGLMCVYPHLYCSLLDLITRDIFEEKLAFKSHWLVYTSSIFKSVAVLVCCLVTYLRPNLLLYLSLGGTVCTSIDSIIYPALVHTIVYWKVSKSKLKFVLALIKNLVILAVGVYLVITGVKHCIQFVNHDKLTLQIQLNSSRQQAVN